MSRTANSYSDLYSIRQFANSVALACGASESVVVLLPAVLGEREAWTVVQREFRAQNIAVSEAMISFAANPAQFFHHHLFGRTGISEEQALDELVERPWPPDKQVVYARGLSARGDDAARWYDVVQNLTRRIAESASARLSPRSVLMFNHLDRDNPRPPEPDRPFRVLWWFGIPSTLDFRLFCRQLLDRNDTLDSITKRWIEYIVPVLAGGDFEQVDKICEVIESNTDDLEMYLANFARQKNWDAETLLKNGAGTFFRSPADLAWTVDPDRPPPNLKLWADGAIYATTEEGVRLHPAAVSILGQLYTAKDLSRRNFRLNHIIWQAQNRLCYGLLNEARLILNEAIEDREAEATWSLRLEPHAPAEKPELKRSNLTCEIGHLGRLCRENKLPVFGTLLGEPIHTMNEVRKHLAHYRPLNLTLLKEFVAVMQALPKVLAECEQISGPPIKPEPAEVQRATATNA